MHLPWKYPVIAGIIIIHAFILALFFSPSQLMSCHKEETPTPQPPVVTPEKPVQESPSVSQDATLSASETQPKDSGNVVETPKKTESTPPQNSSNTSETAKPSSTPPKNNTSPSTPSKANSVSTPTSGSKLNIKPYRTGYYKTGTRAITAKLAQAVNEVRSGILIDLNTHTILWEKNSSKTYPIASLTKMLTSLMLLQHVEATPEVTLDTTIKITKEDRAYFKREKINGVYLDEGETFALRDYLKCMIISSANDAAYIVGKYLGDGKIETGVQRMNEQAKKLGLNDMTFHNPNGLPIDRGKDQRIENTGSALSIAYLAECVMASPEYMKWAGTTRDTIKHRGKPFDLNSTNHLLRDRVPGVTGLKTGYTNTAGYCIAVSCTREGRTILLVVMGVFSNNDRGKRRDEIARQLLDWAYQQPAK